MACLQICMYHDNTYYKADEDGDVCGNIFTCPVISYWLENLQGHIFGSIVCLLVF